MKPLVKFFQSLEGRLSIKALVVCLPLCALSVTTLPTQAGDKEGDARKAFETWRKAVEARDSAKKDNDAANRELQTALTAAAKSGGKMTAQQEEQLARLRKAAADAAAALKAAEDALIKARIALENAIAELPDDSPLKKELKRLRDALTAPPGITSNVQVVNGNGLQRANVETPQGRITINLPDDIVAGDTISGTVVAEPKGKSDEEKARNQAELNGYVIDFGATRQPVSQPSFLWTPGAPRASAPVRIFDVVRGKELATVELEVKIVEATSEPGRIIGGEFPSSPSRREIPPFIWLLPTTGQQGRPNQIYGPFDGNFGTTAIAIGGQDVKKLAESPRKVVFESPVNVTGQTEIVLTENNVETKTSYRNVGLRLSAPKTTLLKGESTTLTVKVEGLGDIQQNMPLELVKNGVVNMEGGDVQTRLIRPAEVNRDGTFTMTRTVTGRETGAFTVTATVVTNSDEHVFVAGPSGSYKEGDMTLDLCEGILRAKLQIARAMLAASTDVYSLMYWRDQTESIQKQLNECEEKRAGQRAAKETTGKPEEPGKEAEAPRTPQAAPPTPSPGPSPTSQPGSTPLAPQSPTTQILTNRNITAALLEDQTVHVEGTPGGGNGLWMVKIKLQSGQIINIFIQAPDKPVLKFCDWIKINKSHDEKTDIYVDSYEKTEDPTKKPTPTPTPIKPPTPGGGGPGTTTGPPPCKEGDIRNKSEDKREFEFIDDDAQVSFGMESTSADGVNAALGMADFWKKAAKVVKAITDRVPGSGGGAVAVGLAIDYLDKGGDILEAVAKSKIAGLNEGVTVHLAVTSYKVTVTCISFEVCENGKWVKKKVLINPGPTRDVHQASRSAKLGEAERDKIEDSSRPQFLDPAKVEQWAKGFLKDELDKLRKAKLDYEEFVKNCK